MEGDTVDARGKTLRLIFRVYLKLGLADKDKRVKFIVKSELNATLDEEVDNGALPRIYCNILLLLLSSYKARS